MSNTVEVVDSFIVTPNPDNFVSTSRTEVSTFVSDSKGVDFGIFRSVQHSDGLSIVCIPVGDFSVGPSGQKLAFIRVEDDLLEQGGLEEGQDSGEVLEVPNDARAVGGGTDSLLVVFLDLDRPDSSSMLFHGSFHGLGLLSDLPDSDLAFHASRDDSFAVGCGS